MDLTNPLPIPGDLALNPGHATIVSVLRHRAVHHPEKKVFTFLATGEEETGQLTYGDLDTAARNAAAHLSAQGLTGKKALMFYGPGLDFITAFFGCLYAGTIPVAAYPPRKNRSLNRIRTIAGDCGAAAILTTESIARSLERNFADDPLLSGMPCHSTDTWPVIPTDTIDFQDPDFESLAFLQYTSGSTGDPKGVMVSHRNIMYNLRSLQMIFSITPDDVAVHWVPQFHDLGLIFGILETVFSGSVAILIPPVVFISNPLCLLQSITRYRVTVSGQPDFAFNHCVDKTDGEQRKNLDLSSLRVMYSGAEPVRKSTLTRFLSAFAPVGLKAESLIPAYGMAESTLILVGGDLTKPTRFLPVKASSLEKNLVVPVEGDIRDSDIAWIASNGTPRMDTAILIADPESGAIMQSGCLGEIWASGNTVAMGYWGKPALTNGVFRASPAGTNDPKWLRTGDLGFLHKGDLYITGRLKDLVIINGRNFYPQDIEEVIGNCHPAVRKSCTAAFAIDVKGKERLAIVAELHRSIFPRDHEKILDAIASSVSVEFEIQPVRITLVRTGAVVKTSSGKIMRRANREALLTGQFEPVSERFYEAQELTAGVYADGGLPSLGQFILSWASARLNNGEPAIPGRSLTSYGLDSMRAMELSEEVKNIFGFEWSPTLFFEEIPIAALVQEGLKIMEEG